MSTNTSPERQCIAFAGSSALAQGELASVARAAKVWLDAGGVEPLLILDADESQTIELDLRGSVDDVVQRVAGLAPNATGPVAAAAGAEPSAATDAPRQRGRPKLGVTAREVTLLPRHWEWLNAQPGGASVTLRKLVERARQSSAGRDALRQAQESAYRFMSTLCGDLPGFEEATRALFAGNRTSFNSQIAAWPTDLRDHLQRLAGRALDSAHQAL